MKALIVGAAGNLGWFLCEKLSREGVEVFALVRPEREVPKGCHKIGMELRNLKLSELPQVDSVIYLAQSKFFREFPDRWDDIFDINVKVPLQLADWARNNGVSGFHYASSGGVYESGVAAVRENAEINANRNSDFYVGSRLSAEVLLRNFSTFFKNFSLIRPFFVYGPNQNRTMLIPRLVDNVRTGREIILVGDVGLKINPIHVTDAARAIAKLIHVSGFNALNIAGTEVLSLKSIAECIGDIVGTKPVFVHKPGETSELIGDISKMCELLGSPRIKFSDGVRELL